MALGNKTVKELPSISSGTPSGLQNTDLFYSQRPGLVDNDYRVSGSDLDTFIAAKGFVRNTMTINGYTLAAPVNLTYADVGAVHNTTTVNGHLLTGAVVISKSDVGLGNVLNTSTANTLAGYNNAGNFAGVTLGGTLTLVAGVLSDGGGTVTAVSIVSAHGFSGSSSGGATPALTINCTITGLLKGDGTSMSAASPGSDYVAPTTTVNGHALSANVTVTASDVGLGSVTNDAQTKAAIVPNTAPSAGQILAGNAGGTAYAPVSMSGNVTMTSAGVTAIGAGQVTNTMLAGSIAASKLIGSDIATVGTLTAGATGAGFTIALTTSTVTGTLPVAQLPAFTGGDVTSSAGSATLSIGAGKVTNAMLAGSITLSNLATQAANTVLANATAGAAVPTAIAIAVSQLFGRGASGNLAPIALGTNLSMSGTTLNAAVAASVAYNAIAGCIPSAMTGNHTTAAMTVSAGQAADSTNAVYIACAGYSWAAANGNAINGTDAASSTLANSTTYHMFLCTGGSGTGVFCSASLTPTFPTGYTTSSRRIFSFNTNGSGAPIPYKAIEAEGGALICWLVTQVLDISTAVQTTSQILYALTVPTGIKVQPYMRVMSGTSGSVIFTSGDETDVAPGAYAGTAVPGYDISGNTKDDSQQVICTTNTSGQIGARASVGSYTLAGTTRGFRDFRRA